MLKALACGLILWGLTPVVFLTIRQRTVQLGTRGCLVVMGCLFLVGLGINILLRS